MGVHSVKQHAAARSAKKQVSASPALTEGTTLHNSSVPVEEEQIGAPTKKQSDPSTKPKGHGILQPKSREIKLKQHWMVRLKMFLSQMFFQRDQLLAQIAEEPEFSEVDRSIGNFELPEEEWEEWKAGPGQPKDEYDLEEEDSKESDTQSIVGMLPKPSKNKKKAAVLLKRKHEDLDRGSDDDSEPEAKMSIDMKPPQINLYYSVCHPKGSQDKHQQQLQMTPMGFPPMMGTLFYPGGFMNPWSMQQAMGLYNGPQVSMLFHHASDKTPPAALTTAADTDINFPDVNNWVMYCDNHPKCS
ncbi:hypothetical protein L208DRAFT_1378718 [Tricholoma matsutake]|nr:hypothetical protein L208DRAFT_1378718 [Tricholoma matsutake 945]